jgi:hypothetical protein
MISMVKSYIHIDMVIDLDESGIGGKLLSDTGRDNNSALMLCADDETQTWWLLGRIQYLTFPRSVNTDSCSE